MWFAGVCDISLAGDVSFGKVALTLVGSRI